MIDSSNLRIKNRGRGVQLEVKHGNTWYIIPTMDNVKVRKPKKTITPREQSLDKKLISRIRTIPGGLNADNPVSIDLDNIITLCATDTNENYYLLGMGVPGQMKVLIHLTRDNSADMKVSLKIADGSTLRQFVSNHAGKALLLFCDGVYWHPVSGEFTNTNSPGAWDIP